jgi:hypothetical protein
VSDLPDILKTNPLRLARLFEAAPETGSLCEAGELGEVYRHQLAAPLAAELAILLPDLEERLRAWREECGEPLVTFSHLLEARRPPLELLEAVKEWAKLARAEPESGIPAEVATALYVTSIALALEIHGQRISALDDSALADGMRWALSLPWLEPRSREALGRALARLGGPGAPAAS